MKKLLFCAGVLALVASCAKYDLDAPVAGAAKSQGIVFEGSDMEPSATRGGFQQDAAGAYEPFWYAETDQINVWAKNVKTKKGNTSGGYSNVSGFGSTGVPVVYKATKSEIKAQFTAVDDANMIVWADKKPNGANVQEKNALANFFAVYPASAATTVSNDVFTITLPTGLANQTQKDVHGAGINDNLVKWSVGNAQPTNSYDAVGETVKFNFNRELNVLRFETKNVKKDYGFGALKTVTAASKGYYAPDAKEGDDPEIEAVPLMYEDGAKLTVETSQATGSGKNYYYSAKSKGIDKTDGATEITLTLSMTEPWADDMKAYMLIADVDRSDFSAAKPDTFEYTYTFENIDFTLSVPTANSWGPDADGVRGMIGVPALDINKYDYLVVNGTDGKHLIVNKYTDKMFDKNGNIVWPVGTEETFAPTLFNKVTSNAAWGKANLTKLAKFTKLTSLILEEDTELPEKMLAKDAAKAMTNFVAPNVTVVPEKVADGQAFMALENLEMPAYEFPNEKVNDLFFNKDVAKTLKNLDISGVTTLDAIYNGRHEIMFKDYEALETVTVYDGVVASASAFENCAKLQSITGALDISKAQKVFKNAGTTAGANGEKFTKINITGTVILDETFSGCSELKEILVNGKQVVPTSIGIQAFLNTKVESMDLSKATTIGKGAFEGCSSYVGNKANTNSEVKVAVTTVDPNIFKGTKVTSVEFTNATKINYGIFSGVSTLKYLKFAQPFTVTDEVTNYDYWKLTFGTVENLKNVDIFINENQLYHKTGSNDLVLPIVTAKDATTGAVTTRDYTFTFHAVKR